MMSIAPGQIRKLDEAVVNRIAAGEIIQRPANALKELIENSLDAGSTSIQITVSDGGLKRLMITDNGSGIRKQDLPILCERYTTSKLKEFEDLKAIATFGFRGEALASMSHVASVSVTTKTEDSPCAWKAEYHDGKLLDPKPGVNPRACAGNRGTTISICDLFYNVPTRRKALTNLNDEYLRIIDVVERYAVHYPKVSFVCKKHGSSNSDIQTVATDNRVSTIKTIYGSKVAKELAECSLELGESDFDYGFKMVSSKLGCSLKKFIFLLFVNDRAVESTSLKALVKNLYAQFLPKGAYPFVYLSIKVPPHKVDVNMHPTKRLVAILNEDSIFEDIVERLSKQLSSVNESRVYYTQSLIQDSMPINTTQSLKRSAEESRASLSSGISQDSKVQRRDNELVRIDSRDQSITDFLFRSSQHSKISKPLTVKPKTTSTVTNVPSKVEQSSLIQLFGMGSTDSSPPLREAKQATDVSNEVDPTNVGSTVRKEVGDTTSAKLDSINESKMDDTLSSSNSDIACQENDRPQIVSDPTKSFLSQKDSNTPVISPDVEDNDGVDENTLVFTDVQLTSVNTMADTIVNKTHSAALTVIRNHVLVGFVDDYSAIIQHDTNLYIINYCDALSDMFYQLSVRGFANFGKITFKKPADIVILLENLLNTMSDINWEKSEYANKSEIIDKCMDLLLEKADMLKEYFSITINSKGLIESIPIILRKYIPDLRRLPLFLLRICSEVEWDDEFTCFNGICKELGTFYRPSSDIDREVVEKVLFDALKKYWRPSIDLVDSKCLIRISNLKNLYKVFERC